MADENKFVFTKNVSNLLMNFGKICRFCFSETQNHISVKDKCLPEGLPRFEQDTIYSFLTSIKIIKMNTAENFPTLVCKDCYEVIKICYNFVKKCQKSENILNDSYEKAMKEAKEKGSLINNVTTNVPGKNLEIINLETNCQSDKNLGKVSKSQNVKVENEINLDSAKIKYPENKLNDYLGSTNLELENESICCSLCSLKFSNSEIFNSHYPCNHEKNLKNNFTEQEIFFTYCKTAFRKEEMEKCKDMNHIKNSVQAGVGKLFCLFCTPFRKFKSEKDLLEHIKNHEIQRLYNCPYCKDKFFSKLSLNQHLLDLHYLKANIVSQEFVKLLKHEQTNFECDKMIKPVPDFMNFYKNKSRNIKVLCKNCNLLMNFATANDFIQHMKSHHSVENMATEQKAELENNSKWKCSDCPAVYSQKQSLFSHINLKHKKQYPKSVRCPVCSETFLTNRKVIQHGIIAHQKYFANFHNVYKKVIQPSQKEVIQHKNFICDMCQKSYIFKTSLKKHIFSVHLKETKDSVSCSYCGKMLANKLNLKSHIEFKHEALFVSCPICRKKINFRTIGRHYKIHKNTSEIDMENSYLCTQCGKILKSKRSFEDHQKLHKNIRNELCDVCGCGYATKKALQLHKKKHEGLERKLHECDQCHKIFSGKHTLNRHLLTHSGVKNFVCEICSKCFYTLQELNRHVRYHKKEYRFECRQCEMRFVDKSRFRHHLMKHKNIRPHKCQFCGKMFIVRGKMNLHMASKHNFQGDSRRVWKDPKAYIPLDELL